MQISVPHLAVFLDCRHALVDLLSDSIDQDLKWTVRIKSDLGLC